MSFLILTSLKTFGKVFWKITLDLEASDAFQGCIEYTGECHRDNVSFLVSLITAFIRTDIVGKMVPARFLTTNFVPWILPIVLVIVIF